MHKENRGASDGDEALLWARAEADERARATISVCGTESSAAFGKLRGPAQFTISAKNTFDMAFLRAASDQ